MNRRNFCKADIPTVTNFVRRIVSATVEQRVGMEDYEAYELNIVGTAFLWHQIRCIASVLTMVGRGLEAPEIVLELLNLEKVPSKPQYMMAEPEPLLLYECTYEELDGQWIRPAQVLRSFDEVVDSEVRKLLTMAHVLLRTRDRAFSGLDMVMSGDNNIGNDGGNDDDGTIDKGLKREPRHIPIMKRNREPLIEDRLARHGLTVVSRLPISDTERDRLRSARGPGPDPQRI